MDRSPFHLNLLCAWLGVLLGFLSGLVFGLFFHRENWLGGYGSFQRRMYRLGHISFFGLAIVNFMFYLTEASLPFKGLSLKIASWAFILGAVSMPACCLLMAHFRRTRLLFSIPVFSLLLGGLLMVIAVTRAAAITRSSDSESARASFQYSIIPSFHSFP